MILSTCGKAAHSHVIDIISLETCAIPPCMPRFSRSFSDDVSRFLSNVTGVSKATKFVLVMIGVMEYLSRTRLPRLGNIANSQQLLHSTIEEIPTLVSASSSWQRDIVPPCSSHFLINVFFDLVILQSRHLLNLSAAGDCHGGAAANYTSPRLGFRL